MEHEDTSPAGTAGARPSPQGGGRRRSPLTAREREIMSLLADGLSGAQIAQRLVLSPETVRTHVRNAMTKLGASTRSQAVVLALQADAAEGAGTSPAPVPSPDPQLLEQLLAELAELPDVDAGAVFLADAEGLALRLVVERPAGRLNLGDRIGLGEGAIGRAALDRRPQLVREQSRGADGPAETLIASPILGAGRVVGAIVLATRASRPVERSELQLLQAFGASVGEILVDGRGVADRLRRAGEGFRSSWSAQPRAL